MQGGKEIVEKGSPRCSPRGPMTPRLDSLCRDAHHRHGRLYKQYYKLGQLGSRSVRDELSLGTRNGERGNERNGQRKRAEESEVK